MADDPRIVDMDPIKKTWMFYSWEQDQIEQNEINKANTYNLAGFINPEAVQKLLDEENGTGGGVQSSDEDFEKSMQMVKDGVMPNINQEPVKKARRRRRKLEKE